MSTQIQLENLKNEYKGALFEYAVALFLAKALQTELHFHKSFITKQQKKLSLKIWSYQKKLQEMEPDLLSCLQSMAQKVTLNILTYLETLHATKKTLYVSLTSKDSAHEGDIYLCSEKEETTFAISLKLCKSGNYVCTKNAVQEYF